MKNAGETVDPDAAVSSHRQDIGERTKRYALRIVRLYDALPERGSAQVIGKQILRSGTSVGAHVAEAAFAKSRADFTCKIDGAMQELQKLVIGWTFWRNRELSHRPGSEDSKASPLS